VAIALLTAVVLSAGSGSVVAQSDRVYGDATGYWRYYNGYWYHYKSYVHGYDPGSYARPDRVLPHGVSPAHYGAYLIPTPGAPAARPVPNPNRPQTVSTPSESPSTALPVYIEVRVLAGAEIWFDDEKTVQEGTVRLFVSPPLPPGRDYTYEVRARWREAGNEVTQSHRVTVRAGQQVSIAFPDTVTSPNK
jgi:uncharacterized protein (TIGR03000 family)